MTTRDAVLYSSLVLPARGRQHWLLRSSLIQICGPVSRHDSFTVFSGQRSPAGYIAKRRPHLGCGSRLKACIETSGFGRWVSRLIRSCRVEPEVVAGSTMLLATRQSSTASPQRFPAPSSFTSSATAGGSSNPCSPLPGDPDIPDSEETLRRIVCDGSSESHRAGNFTLQTLRDVSRSGTRISRTNHTLDSRRFFDSSAPHPIPVPRNRGAVLGSIPVSTRSNALVDRGAISIRIRGIYLSKSRVNCSLNWNIAVG